MPATVLAVHNNVAFLLALAVQLENRKIHLIPAATVRQARSLLDKLKLKPRVVIVNCRLSGVCQFAMELQERRPRPKIAGIVSEGSSCAKCRAILSATVEMAPQQTPQMWVGVIRALL